MCLANAGFFLCGEQSAVSQICLEVAEVTVQPVFNDFLRGLGHETPCHSHSCLYGLWTEVFPFALCGTRLSTDIIAFLASSGEGILPLNFCSSILLSLFIIRQFSIDLPSISIVYFSGLLAINVCFTRVTYQFLTLSHDFSLFFKSSFMDDKRLRPSQSFLSMSFSICLSSGCLSTYLQ